MSESLKNEIMERVKQYYDLVYKKREFKVGRDYINYSGYTGDEEELQSLVECTLRQWFTSSHFCNEFSNKLCCFLNVKHCVLTNSGSSANLLAISSLELPKGSEVITTACCFPTTIAPIIQNSLVPVFVDIDQYNFNIIPEKIEAAISRKTKAIFLTHSFGNPVNMDKILDISEKYGLKVISDCCDALGAKWYGKNIESLGDVSTLSFYPAHHITTGEGGAIVTNSDSLKRKVQSYRDWGRDCWCSPGDVSKCGNRFKFKFGKLPKGYDHKYIFTSIGYNLKMSDLHAAIGNVQIDRLYEFIRKRNENFNLLYNTFKKYPVTLPKVEVGAQPSWFAFPFTYKHRDKLTGFLEKNKIQTRFIFAGNILKQPAFMNIKHRSMSNLPNTNKAMNQSCFLGVYPGLDEEKMGYIQDKIREYFKCHA